MLSKQLSPERAGVVSYYWMRPLGKTYLHVKDCLEFLAKPVAQTKS
jgi:hypothetical protein